MLADIQVLYHIDVTFQLALCVSGRLRLRLNIGVHSNSGHHCSCVADYDFLAVVRGQGGNLRPDPFA